MMAVLSATSFHRFIISIAILEKIIKINQVVTLLDNLYRGLISIRDSYYCCYVVQVIRKQPMTVYGDGKQTRSFQYVSDLVCHVIILKRNVMCLAGTTLITRGPLFYNNASLL